MSLKQHRIVMGDIEELARAHEQPIVLRDVESYLTYIKKKTLLNYEENYQQLDERTCELFDDIPTELFALMAHYGKDIYRSLLAIPKFARHVSHPAIQEYYRSYYTITHSLSNPIATDRYDMYDMAITMHQCGPWIHRSCTMGPAIISTFTANMTWQHNFRHFAFGQTSTPSYEISEYIECNKRHNDHGPALIIKSSDTDETYEEYWHHGLLYGVMAPKNLQDQYEYHDKRFVRRETLQGLLNEGNTNFRHYQPRSWIDRIHGAIEHYLNPMHFISGSKDTEYESISYTTL